MKKIQPIVQTLVVGALLFTIAFSCWFKPYSDYSVSERTPLKPFPELSADSVMSGKFMTEFEDYVTKQFPQRDWFRSLKAWMSKYVFAQKDNNNIYEADGYLAEMEYPQNPQGYDTASKTFDRIYSKYLSENNRVFMTVIPDKNAFMAAQSGHLSMDYEAFYEMWRTFCARPVCVLSNTPCTTQDECTHKPFASYIDIAPLLELSDYYATDTHWRQECIVDVATAIAEAAGITLPADYTKNELDHPFYGVHSGHYALPVEPDTMYYLTNDTIDAMTAFDHEHNAAMPIYSMEKAAGYDPYEMFLSGALSLITIDNPNAASDKELIVFRDSFGSSLTPLLAQGYKKVTMVDIRYISSHTLDRFIEFGDQDVLFVYSTLVLNDSQDTFK